MPKSCGNTDCIWSECNRFCTVIDKASVPLDHKWPLVILYLRGIKDVPVLSETQKGRLQELMLIILQQKDYSDARYEEVHKMILDIINAPVNAKLEEVARETAELAKDVQSMFGKHTRHVSAVVTRVDEDLASGREPASLLAELRDTLKDVVGKMEKDASLLMSLSHKDSLTGLANRRAFDRFLANAVEHWQHNSIPLALIMLDIDHFKQLNDSYGHLMGDEVLKGISSQMQKIAASLDNDKSSLLAARYGGEEFALILSGEVTDRAALVADNLRRTIQKTTMHFRDANGKEVVSNLRVTVSVGVAEMWMGWQGAHLTNLVDFADKALYHAKRNGRNCTAQYVPDKEEPFAIIAKG